MENEWLLGFATSLEERISILQDFYTLNNLDYLEAWLNRKTLLRKSDFYAMLKYRNLTKEQYNLGVSPLNEQALQKLFAFIQTQSWYKLHKELFKMAVAFKPIDLKAALRFHVSYYISHINDFLAAYNNIKLSNACIRMLEEDLYVDLFSISKRTLVWDVHDIIERRALHRSAPDEEFQVYLFQRFSNAQLTELFFLEYPTLARILAERLQFRLNNFHILIESLSAECNNLNDVFKISPPFYITEWKANKGDSHNKGKSTTLLTINGLPVVFKYHNNDIIFAYHQLLEFIENLDPQLKFYKIRCISGKDYCFEEFINHENCRNGNEIKEYYRNYGYLTAIAHWLGSTDLHMENLIAKSKYPVLIDYETILRSDNIRCYDNNSSKSQYFEDNSVITTGLLPMQKYWKRQLDFSALNGVSQKIPFKVRKLIHEDSSNIMFQLDEEYVQPAQNIPLFHGIAYGYKGYEENIITGYQHMSSLLMQNKQSILNLINKLFSNKQLRIVLRDTQDYQNFLDFSTHPSCMTDYIEREKIFENLWRNSFIKQELCILEIKPLLAHDVPYFYTLSNSLDLFSDGQVYKKLYSRSIMEVLNNHIGHIDIKAISFSRLLLAESLDVLEAGKKKITIQKRNMSITNPILQKAADIADYIFDRLTVSEEEQLIIWAEITKCAENKFSIIYPDQNLYNGTTGLFIFFYCLYNYIPSSKYKKLLNVLETEIFCHPTKSEAYGAFHGAGARLTAAFIVYRYKQEPKYYEYINENLQLIFADIESYHSWDWIYGNSGLLCILSRIYKELKLPSAQKIISACLRTLRYDDITDTGFAHGLAGIMYSLLQVRSLFKSNDIDNRIKDLKEKILLHINSVNNSSPSWCKGSYGIHKALQEFEYAFLPQAKRRTLTEPSYPYTDSCLCHGRYGSISYIIEQYLKGFLSKTEYEKQIMDIIDAPIILYAGYHLIPLGLYTGLSGLGYQLLRTLEPVSLLDILFF